MSVNARGKRDGRKVHAVTKRQQRPTAAAELHMQIVGVEVVMSRSLTTWMILAGGIAVVTATFFTSAGITHWVMGLRHTVVVVRPGPTVYLPSPPAHAHNHG